MTVKNIIEQAEKMFGRQSEQYMFQLINDALDTIAAEKQHRIVSKTTNLIGFDSFCGFPEIINTRDRRILGKPIAKGQWNVSTINSIRNFEDVELHMKIYPMARSL